MGFATNALADPAKDVQVAARALGFLQSEPTGHAVIGVVFDSSNPASTAQKDAVMATLGAGMTAGAATFSGKAIDVSQLGSAGGVPNPFGVFGHHFTRVRVPGSGTTLNGGHLGASAWFTGKTIGSFGGVRWNTPVKGLSLRLEYDGNNYEHEAVGTHIAQALPLNAGLEYTPWRNVELGIGYERGDKLTAHIDVGVDFNHYMGPPKVSDPPPAPVAVRPAPAPLPMMITS